MNQLERSAVVWRQRERTPGKLEISTHFVNTLL